MNRSTCTMIFAAAAAWAAAASARADDPKSPGPPPPPKAVELLERAWPGHPEWLAMFVDILEGSQLGPGDGWFRKAKSRTRFDWEAARAAFDADGDGRVARGEFPGPDGDFARLDRDRDGALGPADFDFSAHALAPSPGSMLFYSADRDGNGKVTREEFEGLFRALGGGEDGFLALSELQAAFTPPARGRGSSGGPGGPSRWTLLKGLFRQEIGSLRPGPGLDEPAPDFALKTVEGDREVRLSDLLGPRPVVLVFGNFTCGPFRSQAGNVEKLYRRYKDRAEFVLVYVREAHPTDGWSMESNDRVGVALRQPRSYAERVGVAQACSRTLGLGMPMLVDTLDDAVGARDSGMPSRLYLLDGSGRVAFKSGRGPFGFKPAELEQALLLLLNRPEPPAAADAPREFPVPDDASAWAALPRAARGGGPLPSWARMTAPALPRTTAAMLDLDRLHRTRSPLGGRLRGMMRWVAAEANRSAYGRAQAEADLRREGHGDALAALSGDRAGLPDAERAALDFARKLTLAADTVTDPEVAGLMEAYGPHRVAAMVLLLAHANFQDRLLLALDAPIEPGGPPPPADVAFAADAPPPPVPPRGRPEGRPTPDRVDDPDWADLDFDDLQRRLDGQRGREGRVRVPTWAEVEAVLPPGYPRPKAPIRIQWSLVCMGYQPELAAAWSACTRAFGEEAKQDRVFEESLFWVVTRTIHCFY